MLKLLDKSTKRTVSLSVVISTSLLALTVFASGSVKQVQKGADAYPVQYSYSDGDSVRDLLEGIRMNVIMNDEKLSAQNYGRDVKKTKKVNIFDGDERLEIYTTAQTVGDLMEDGVISIDEKIDFMNMNAEDEIEDGMIIEITRVTSEVVSVEEAIEFETIKRENNLIPKGEVRVVSEGSNGILLTNTEIIFHNGVQVDKIVTTAEKVKPVSRIVEYGTGDYALGSKISNLSYSKVIKCNATAYCSCSKCCGKSTGITASGMRAQYGVVAVDPRVIPLGTKLYIESPDGSFTYGYSVAADTGGAIKGNKVDLYFSSHGDALNFGRRTVNVYIVS